MTTADYNKEITLTDGLVSRRTPMFAVVVTANGKPRHQSEPLTEAEARTRMAKIINVYTVDLGYKQTPTATYTTLKNGKFEVQIRLVAV